MSVLWFFIAVTFLVLWLNEKSKRSPRSGDNTSYDYARGYWDGYRALCDELIERVKTKHIDIPLLAKLKDKSYAPGTNEAHQADDSSEPTATRVTDAINTTPQTMPETIQPQPQLSAEEQQAVAEARTLRNLNILLYVGSFLIVAAAALFVTLTMPAAVKLIGLILVTAAFYLSGLILHTTSARLKPAALAFVGTGLAMIPFIGFALASLGGLSGASAWFITSAVGLAAYFVAALRLQSEFISYVTMAFVLSLALSAVSSLSLSILWYFIVVIGVSLICNSLRILWPGRIPRTFTAPIELTGTVTTPIALVASLLAGEHMKLYMYEVLFGITTAHYMVLWLEKRSVTYETVVRVLAHATLLIVAFDVSGFNPLQASTVVTFGFWWLALALVQATYSLLRTPHATPEGNSIERLWVCLAMGAMVIGLLFWTNDQHALLATLSLGVVGSVALGATLRYREAGWAYVILGASVVLPFLVGRGVIQPAVSYEVIALCFAALTPLALVAYDRAVSLGRSNAVRTVFLIATLCYGMLITFTGLLSQTALTIGWTTLLSATTLIAVSYVVRHYALEIGGALFGVVSVVAWIYASSLASDWQSVAWMTGATALLLVGAMVHHIRRELLRRDSLVALAIGTTGLLVVTPTSSMAPLATATVVLTVAGIAGVVVRLIQTTAQSNLALLARLACALFPILAFITSCRTGLGWATLTLAVGTGIAWIASFREKVPALLVLGNALLVIMLTCGWWWLWQYTTGKEWLVHSVCWAAAAVFYAQYWLMVDKKDTARQPIALLSTVITLGIASVAGLYVFSIDYLVAASAGSLITLAAVVAVHGYRTQQQTYSEVAVYLATFGLQRLVALLIPDISMVFYAHWWALTIGLMAAWRTEHRRARAMIALGFVTASSGIYALQYASGYALFFLIEHCLLLVAGAVLRQQWVLWWGVAAVIVAVLYFLRDYTFLALLFLGFLIILFVIWRLTKVAKK